MRQSPLNRSGRCCSWFRVEVLFHSIHHKDVEQNCERTCGGVDDDGDNITYLRWDICITNHPCGVCLLSKVWYFYFLINTWNFWRLRSHCSTLGCMCFLLTFSHTLSTVILNYCGFQFFPPWWIEEQLKFKDRPVKYYLLFGPFDWPPLSFSCAFT